MVGVGIYSGGQVRVVWVRQMMRGCLSGQVSLFAAGMHTTLDCCGAVNTLLHITRTHAQTVWIVGFSYQLSLSSSSRCCRWYVLLLLGCSGTGAKPIVAGRTSAHSGRGFPTLLLAGSQRLSKRCPLFIRSSLCKLKETYRHTYIVVAASVLKENAP